MELGPGLKPMTPFREDMVFLKGLFNEQAVRHKSPHLGRMANMLSGAWVSTDQNEIRVGTTMDQVLAAAASAARPPSRASSSASSRTSSASKTASR